MSFHLRRVRWHNKVADRIQSITDGVDEWIHSKPWSLAIGGLIFAGISSQIYETILIWLQGSIGATRDQIVFGLFALVVLFISLSFLLVRHFKKGYVPMPSGLETVTRFTPADLLNLSDGLHTDIYDGEGPDSAAILEMYQRNPGMGVALREMGTDRFIAFTTAWPLGHKTAQLVLSGKLPESALQGTQILTESENAEADFLLVPAFGIAEAFRTRKTKSALLQEFRYSLRTRYFVNAQKEITVIGTGFTKEGCELLAHFGLAPNGAHSTLGSETYPIYQRTMTQSDIDKLGHFT
jgi:hypothetical protein